MSTMQQFYLNRASEAERDAEAATLDNARNRFLTAATTWTQLAARAGRVDTMLADRVEERRVRKATGALSSPLIAVTAP
jgi:hypothetical protein